MIKIFALFQYVSRKRYTWGSDGDGEAVQIFYIFIPSFNIVFYFISIQHEMYTVDIITIYIYSVYWSKWKLRLKHDGERML